MGMEIKDLKRINISKTIYQGVFFKLPPGKSHTHKHNLASTVFKAVV